MRKVAVRCSTVVFTASILSGCGGGGGSDNSTTPPKTEAPKPISETLSITTSENQQVTQALRGTPVSTTRIRGTEAITADTTEDGTLNISVAELQNEGDARFKVTTKDGNTTIEYIVSVSAENTSARASLEQAEQITQVSAESLALTDEQRLAQIALEIEYLTGAVDATLKDMANTEIEQTITEAGASLTESQSQLAQAIKDYQNGTATEAELAEHLVQMDTDIQAINETGTTVLAAVETTLVALGVDLPETLTFTYDEALGRYTRFTSPDLGAYNDNGEWVFNAEYDWLNAALPLTTQTQR